MAKKPTGARPKPNVPSISSPKVRGTNTTRPAAKHTSMPASRRNATMGDTSKKRMGY